jgi:hypothetical protein
MLPAHHVLADGTVPDALGTRYKIPRLEGAADGDEGKLDSLWVRRRQGAHAEARRRSRFSPSAALTG